MKDLKTESYLKELLTHLNNIKIKDHSANSIQSYEDKIIETALDFTGKYKKTDEEIVFKTLKDYANYLNNLQDYKKLGAILVIAREQDQDLEEDVKRKLNIPEDSPVSKDDLLGGDLQRREVRLLGLFKFIESFKRSEADHELLEFSNLSEFEIKETLRSQETYDAEIIEIVKKIQKRIINKNK